MFVLQRRLHMFDEEPLFQAMEEKRDILNGLHANTTIPKIIGALKRYLACKAQERYLTVAENFWEMVVNHHTYIIVVATGVGTFWRAGCAGSGKNSLQL